MVNLRNSSERANTLEWREMNLKLAKYCLERYKETKNKVFYEWAKVFGEWSLKIKQNYL